MYAYEPRSSRVMKSVLDERRAMNTKRLDYHEENVDATAG